MDTDFKNKIAQLTQEIKEREEDIARFQKELVHANEIIEGLIQDTKIYIETISEIQKFIVPTEFSNISSFNFSTKFIPGVLNGGDYMDIFEHDSQFRFGILMSSATEYQISSTLLSLFLRFSSEMKSFPNGEPDQILTKIIKKLPPYLKKDSKAYLFYAVIDQRRFLAQYCLTGGILGLHYSSKLKEISLLNCQNFLDGKKNPFVKTWELALNPKDLIVIASPGLLEAQNSKGEVYGKERLLYDLKQTALKDVHEIRNRILFNIEKFSDKKNIEKDISLIVCRVKDRIIKLT